MWGASRLGPRANLASPRRPEHRPADRLGGGLHLVRGLGLVVVRHPVLDGSHGEPARAQPFRSSGTLPPFPASLRITALCRATFSSALPAAPVEEVGRG